MTRFLVPFLTALALLLAGCGDGSNGGSDGGSSGDTGSAGGDAAQSGGEAGSSAGGAAAGAKGDKVILRWASQGDALTYDPQAQNETPTNAAQMHVYEPLVMRGRDMSIVPALAVSWDVVEPTVWRFELREGVRFHGGERFTAQDVKFTIERAQSQKSDFKAYVEKISEVRIVDDFTVEFVTDAPFPLLLENLTQIFVMSKAWAEEHNVVSVQDRAAGEETYAVRNANGTGPFKLVVREPDVRTIWHKNNDWWGLEQYPHNIDEVHYTPIANQATRVAALLSGELDFLLDPPLQDVRRIEAQADLKTASTPQTRTIFFGLDQGSEELRSSNVEGKNPFADQRVREAMYRAIDAEAIQRTIMRGRSQPAGMLIAPGVNGYSEQDDTRLEVDQDRAKALLAEAGYPDGFEVTLDCPNDRYINDEAICNAVVSMLSKVGITVNLDSQPKSLHFPKIEQRTTDFYLLGWGVPTFDSEYVFAYLYRTDGSWNAANYSNPKVDELLGLMGSETDRAERNALIKQTWSIVLNDVAYLPLHHQVITWAMRDNVDVPIMVDDMPRFFYSRVEK